MPSDERKTDPGLRTVMVYRARNPAEAHIIQMALEEGGVRVFIEGEVLQGLVPEVPVWDAAPRIYVEVSQAATARGIIERAQRRQDSKPDKGEVDTRR